jgi:soluble cytochrome b562
MDYQQSDEKSEKISEILKSVYDWLGKTDKSKRSIQRSDENSEKISEIRKRINKWLEETDKSSKEIPELNSGLKFPIMQLEEALDKIVKKVQEATNLPEIRIYDARVDLTFSKQDYEGLRSESHYIKIQSYSTKIIECYSNSRDYYDRFRCIQYNIRYIFESAFELLKSHSPINDISSIIGPFKGIYYTLSTVDPILKEKDEIYKYIRIYGEISRDLNKQTMENARISKHKKSSNTYEIEYDKGPLKARLILVFGRSYTDVTALFYDPFKS